MAAYLYQPKMYICVEGIARYNLSPRISAPPLEMSVMKDISRCNLSITQDTPRGGDCIRVPQKNLVLREKSNSGNPLESCVQDTESL